MCELDQLQEMGGVNRRQFTAMGALAAFAAACAPVEGSAAGAAGGLAEGMVSFPAPGGTMDAFFVHPAKGKHPAVIMWPDIASLRDAFKVMARRLASSGYSVIVPNPFYKDTPAPQFADFDAFRKDNGFQKVGPWMAHNTPAAVAEMAKAVVAWLDKQPSVDTRRGIGVQGYCMSGTWTVRTAAAVPGRVKAGGSFHGGNSWGDGGADSPDSLFAKTRASFLIAQAKNDDAQKPEVKTAIKAAADAAGRPATVEVYQADHGWTVPDSPVYNQAEADRAWNNLLALYSKAL
jgi:carboxymethylenebutenolidase